MEEPRETPFFYRRQGKLLSARAKQRVRKTYQNSQKIPESVESTKIPRRHHNLQKIPQFVDNTKISRKYQNSQKIPKFLEHINIIRKCQNSKKIVTQLSALSHIPLQTIGIISFIAFTAYIIKFSLTTLEHFKDPSTTRYRALTIIHLIVLIWFTIDFCLRAIFSPNKVAFLKSPYTWTDLSSVISMYMFYLYPELEKVPFLEMLALLKVLRIFQLFKLSYVLQVLVNTLKASSRELCLLVIFMGFVMLLFATVVYFLERHESAEDFRSVPHSMWWAVITMTTVRTSNDQHTHTNDDMKGPTMSSYSVQYIHVNPLKPSQNKIMGI